MSGRLTAVVLANSPDYSDNRTVEMYDKLGSKWAIVYFDSGAASRIKNMRPHIEVAVSPFHPPEEIMRIYPNPHDYVDAIAKNYGGDKRLWWIVGNEIGYSKAWAEYTCEVIRYGVPKGYKFLVGHWFIGSPREDQYEDPPLLELYRLCSQYRDNVILCGHEGGTAPHLACAGFIGGSPKGIHLIDGKETVIHPDFTKRENWPASRINPDGSEMTMWLSGRLQQRVGWACKKHNIPEPRMGISETSKDWLDALNTNETLNWLQNQPFDRTRYHSIQAWRSGAVAMKQYYPDWQPDEAFARELIYQDQVIYEGSPVEFVAVFNAYSYPHDGAANWREHNILGSDTANFHNTIGDYQYGRVIQNIPPIPGGQPQPPAPIPVPPPPPPEPPPPVDDRPTPGDNWIPAILRTKSGQTYVNIRLRRDVASDDLGDIPNGAALWWIKIADPDWFAVWYNDVIGFVSSAVAVIEDYPTPEPPPPADTVAVKRTDWLDLTEKLDDFLAVHDRIDRQFESEQE